LFINNLAYASKILSGVKELGVSVSLDDFGTGYSSLATLRSFPFDRIKIDRSFVFDMVRNSDAAAIVNSVLGLGRAMGFSVVAEGVESEEQRNLLKALGCQRKAISSVSRCRLSTTPPRLASSIATRARFARRKPIIPHSH